MFGHEALEQTQNACYSSEMDLLTEGYRRCVRRPSVARVRCLGNELREPCQPVLSDAVDRIKAQ